MTWLDDERIIACVLDFDRTQRLIVSKLGAEAAEVSIEQPIAAAIVVRRDEVLLLGDRTEAFDAHDLSRRGGLDVRSHAWHPGTQEALSFASLEGAGPWSLVSRPRSPVNVEEEIASMARREQAHPSPQGRLVLADALEAAGHHGEALDHLRSEAAHGHRCFIVDDLASG